MELKYPYTREFPNKNGFSYCTAMYEKHFGLFMAAITHLFDKGYETICDITDEDINEMLLLEEERQAEARRDGKISMLGCDFIAWLYYTAREVANQLSTVELIAWLEAAKPYDCKEAKKTMRGGQ